MKLKFLGTNGFYSTQTGSTVCTLIETQDLFIVFDAGEGIYKLDQYLNSPKPIYLFLSHFHLDHIQGLHVFAKFKFKQTLTIIGQPGTQKILNHVITHPFTVPFEKLKIKVNFLELKAGQHQPPQAPLPLESRLLDHADPCFGYRLKVNGKTITYCTDTGPCPNLFKLSHQADLFISECTLKSTQKANPHWPHLRPQDAASYAKKAQVKKLFLTHFGAYHYSTRKERQEAAKIAQKIFPITSAAFDNLEVDL